MTAVPVAARRGGAVEASLTDIDGRRVARFRLAGGPHRGAIGPVEGQIIERLIRTALEIGVPVVGELSTAGADVKEGLASLHAWGRVARALTDASGAVPIVFSVVGPCVAGPALLLGIADHVVMTADAYAYVSGPHSVEEFTGLPTTGAELGGADVHTRRSGVASLTVADEAEAAWAVGDLLSYLPSNWREAAPVVASDDPIDRPCRVAATTVPDRATASYDVRTVIGDVLDRESFLEVRPGAAPNVVTGYGRLAGGPVGVIANQPSYRAGTLDIDASTKAARFVQCCDAFGLPLVTFVDSSGFQPGKDIEWQGIIRYGAQLVAAYAGATVPRVCVVLRKAYGGAYIVMDSRGLGSDLVLAWPTAEIAVMGAPGAVQILHRRRLDSLDDPAARATTTAQLEAEYSSTFCTPLVSAERGFVDDVIQPDDTRRLLVAGLAALRSKRVPPPAGLKHTNPPL